jgi:lysozyme family protein
MARSQPAVDYAIWNETGGRADGALTRDPRDPGGTTKWGIAQRSHPRVNVAALTRLDACAIYVTEYWEPERGLALVDEQRCATKVFDHMVHLGLRGGALAAQRALNDLAGRAAGYGALREDGDFGPVSAAALNRLPPDTFLIEFARHLAAVYELICQRHEAAGDPGYGRRFLAGFLNRARRLPA